MSVVNASNTAHAIRLIIEDIAHGRKTAAEGNVALVRTERVRVIRGKMPREVRGHLTAAVKRGELCHLKKDGLAPEVYYHPNFEGKAKEVRARERSAGLKALAGIVARPGEAAPGEEQEND